MGDHKLQHLKPHMVPGAEMDEKPVVPGTNEHDHKTSRQELTQWLKVHNQVDYFGKKSWEELRGREPSENGNRMGVVQKWTRALAALLSMIKAWICDVWLHSSACQACAQHIKHYLHIFICDASPTAKPAHPGAPTQCALTIHIMFFARARKATQRNK